MKRIVLVISVAFSITSCATIFTGTTARITIQSPDARRVDLTVDDEEYRDIVLPTQITVKRGFNPTIIQARTNDREGTVTVGKSFNEVSLVNILLGGIPGMLVDCISGAITKPDMPSYTIYLDYYVEPTEEVIIPYRPDDSIL